MAPTQLTFFTPSIQFQMCTNANILNLMTPTLQLSSAKPGYPLKVELQQCEEQSITLQFTEKFSCLNFAQSFKDDWRAIVLDIPALLREYQNDCSLLSSWPELLKSPLKQEFLYYTELSSKVKGSVKDWPALDIIRLHIAKQLHELTELIVFVNHNGLLHNFDDLLSDVEVYLPKVKKLMLENGTHAHTDAVWKMDREGRMSQKKMVKVVW